MSFKTIHIIFFILFSGHTFATSISRVLICTQPKKPIYPYACDFDKWGFSDKDGNIKIRCKYEASYVVRGTCSVSNPIREDVYFVRKKGKLYILDNGQEVRFTEMDTLPSVYSIDSQYIVFRRYGNLDYQIYLRKFKKLITHSFSQPPEIDQKSKLIYGQISDDSVRVLRFNDKKVFTKKGITIDKFGKTFLINEDNSILLFNEKGKRLNTNIYKSFYRKDKNANFLYLQKTDAPIKLLLPNGDFYDTKLYDGGKNDIYFYQRSGISIFINNQNSIFVYDHWGSQIIKENVIKVIHSESFTYLVAENKTYLIGAGNKILNCVDYLVDEIKGKTFIKYLANLSGKNGQIVDSTYIYDQNLKLLKKYLGYVGEIFFDSLYYIENENFKYLSNFKDDTLIFCKPEAVDINITYTNDMFNSKVTELWGENLFTINGIRYNYKNGILSQMSDARQISFHLKYNRNAIGYVCKIDTNQVKYKVVDHRRNYQIQKELEEKSRDAYESRFWNNKEYGFLNVQRDTIVPFDYKDAISYMNFITFEKDTLWTVFDTLTYESKTYDRRDIIQGLRYVLLPNKFFTVQDVSNPFHSFVYHLDKGLLLGGKSVYDFSYTSYDEFMLVQYYEHSPEMLIHVKTGLLIDDYESYDSNSFINLEVLTTENQAIIFNSKIQKVHFIHASYNATINNENRFDDFAAVDIDQKSLFLNTKTMKILASEALIEKIRIKKYKSIF